MQQDDPENSIYYYSYFSEDESDTDAGDYLDDVRLYTGGHLKIDTGLVVQFHSENAQTEQMQLEETADGAGNIESRKHLYSGNRFPGRMV